MDRHCAQTTSCTPSHAVHTSVCQAGALPPTSLSQAICSAATPSSPSMYCGVLPGPSIQPPHPVWQAPAKNSLLCGQVHLKPKKYTGPRATVHAPRGQTQDKALGQGKTCPCHAQSLHCSCPHASRAEPAPAPAHFPLAPHALLSLHLLHEPPPCPSPAHLLHTFRTTDLASWPSRLCPAQLLPRTDQGCYCCCQLPPDCTASSIRPCRRSQPTATLSLKPPHHTSRCTVRCDALPC